MTSTYCLNKRNEITKALCEIPTSSYLSASLCNRIPHLSRTELKPVIRYDYHDYAMLLIPTGHLHAKILQVEEGLNVGNEHANGR